MTGNLANKQVTEEPAGILGSQSSDLFGSKHAALGTVQGDSCDRGVEQTADHITSPISRPPKGINGIIYMDDKTRARLENNALDIHV